jgi:hypothetical protein
MSETGTKDWLVEGVREGKTEPNPHGGELTKWYVDFQGSPDTYWRRKAGDTPEVGKSYYGTITIGDYGPRFKKEKKLDGSGASGGSNGSWGGKSPDQQASIVRQHSQEMALRYLAIFGDSALEANDADGLITSLVGEVKPIIDWFEADANKAQLASQQPRQGPGTSLDRYGVAERIESLLTEAGENASAAHTISDYAISEMTPQEQDAAIDHLQKPDHRAGAVKRLRERTEQFHGQPLPNVDPDLDAPF